MQMFFASQEDKIMFFDTLRDNVKLLLGNDDVVNETFIGEFFKYLEYILIYDWNYKDEDIKEEIDGITDLSESGITAIKMKGNKGYVGDKKNISLLFSHELWHAIITVLNYMQSSNYERVINYDNMKLKVNNHSGFYGCHYKFDFMVGYLLHECMVDILAYTTCNLKTDKKFIIEYALYYAITDEYMDAPYDDFLTLCQLFIAAFNLDSNNTFQKNYLDKKGLLGNYIIKNDKKVIANLFIEGTLKNPIEILDEYDRFMGEGTYISLLKDIDVFYERYIRNKRINVKVLYSVCDNLSEFVNRRLKYYLTNNYIDEEEYNNLTNNYLEILEAFKEEILCYNKKKREIIKTLINKFRR